MLICLGRSRQQLVAQQLFDLVDGRDFQFLVAVARDVDRHPGAAGIAGAWMSADEWTLARGHIWVVRRRDCTLPVVVQPPSNPQLLPPEEHSFG